MGILTDYIMIAMEKKVTEKLEDGSYYAYIPSCPGVWANEMTIDECHAVLREVLEGWLLIKLLDNDQLKPIDGISLNVTDLQKGDG